MSPPNKVKIEKIKLWQVILGLMTAAISLVIAIIALLPKEPANITEKDEPQSSTLPSVPVKEPNPTAQENTAEFDKIESGVPSYDTLKVYLPSKLQLQEVMIDGDPVNIFRQTPTAAWLRFRHKENNRQLLFVGKSQKCTVSQYFQGSGAIAVTLSDCQ